MLYEAKKPKMAKVYKITNRHESLYGGRVREYTSTGTLEELIDQHSYTLEKGKSWESEKGNHKINMKPKTIESLCKNLQWASDNAAANGYSGDYYTYELIGEQPIEEIKESKTNSSKKALYESLMKKTKHINEQYSEDGWDSEDDLYELTEILEEIQGLQYEIKNCIRGCYTKCHTYEELGSYVEDLGEQLSTIGKNISCIEERKFDSEDDI